MSVQDQHEFNVEKLKIIIEFSDGQM